MARRPFKKRHVALAVFALLTLASNLWLRVRPPPFFERGAALSANVPVFDSTGRVPGDTVRIAFNDSAPGDVTRPTVILIHGSPGSAGNFSRLAPFLTQGYRVISIDNPGFGGSTSDIPDYSFRAHGHYTLALMDALGLRDAHLVGFSMGGGVVLSMADIAPARVKSIVMLSAIGAQEFELMGDYHLNHAIHGLQLGLFRVLYYGLPHFGLLPNGLTYARNFFDSDQRPLRQHMLAYQAPMLIFQPAGALRSSRRARAPCAAG
jgi:pimeloyl-ACP methyl ester carboxylesterase